MSFLTRTPGMTIYEARSIVNLHELVERSLLHGPVTLEVYASIVQSSSDRPESWERHFMRTKAELAQAGFQVPSEGKHENLTADFGADEALRGEVERSLDEAIRLITSRNGSGHSDAEEALYVPPDALADAHRLGLDVRRLCRRFHIGTERALMLLHAKGVEPREARPLRIEERRSSEVVKAALEARGSGAGLRRVAGILGCSPETARAFLRRLRSL